MELSSFSTIELENMLEMVENQLIILYNSNDYQWYLNNKAKESTMINNIGVDILALTRLLKFKNDIKEKEDLSNCINKELTTRYANISVNLKI